MLIQIGGAILTNTQNCERLFCSELQCNINRLIISLIDTDVLHDFEWMYLSRITFKSFKTVCFLCKYQRSWAHTRYLIKLY
jgi:hypothetical protein